MCRTRRHSHTYTLLSLYGKKEEAEEDWEGEKQTKTYEQSTSNYPLEQGAEQQHSKENVR